MSLAIFLLYLIYFLDAMGIVFVYVIFSPLILDPIYGMVDLNTALSMRNLILGFLLGIYALGQFFAAPIFGDFSDRYGRRNVLLLTIFVTGLAFIGSGVAIVMRSLWLLFVTRLIAGFSAGNLTVAQAAVSNLVSEEKRPAYMSWFATIGGISWTIGPVIGFILALRNLSDPFFALGIVFWLVMIGIHFTLKESIDKSQIEKHSIRKIVRNIFSALSHGKVMNPFIASALVMLGWMMYQAFLGAYLINRFQFPMGDESYAYAFSSLCWFLGGLSSMFLLKHFKAHKLIILPLYLSAFAVLAYFLTNSSEQVWPLMFFANFTQAIATACFFALFSTMLPPEMQGRIFGGWSAGFALASALGPAISGYLSRFDITIPYLVGGAIMLAVSIYYNVWHRVNRDSVV